jgi:GR25 family glycosyltransferase involved in LPS biosynthesis
MEALYGPVVINLDSRPDRLEMMRSEFLKLNANFQRLSASTGGALGCIDSHCRALELFIQHESATPAVMICEDDALFQTDRATLDQHIREFLSNPDAKVACLGFNARVFEPYSTLYNRCREIQTRVCYIVKREFARELNELWRQIYAMRISNKPTPWYEQAYRSLPISNPPADIYRGDQSWKLLQQTTVFLTPKTRLVIQRPSFSDIEQRHVNYKV